MWTHQSSWCQCKTETLEPLPHDLIHSFLVIVWSLVLFSSSTWTFALKRNQKNIKHWVQPIAKNHELVCQWIPELPTDQCTYNNHFFFLYLTLVTKHLAIPPWWKQKNKVKRIISRNKIKQLWKVLAAIFFFFLKRTKTKPFSKGTYN